MPHRPTEPMYRAALARRTTGDYLNLPASLVIEDHKTITAYESGASDTAETPWHVRKPNGQYVGPYTTHAEALAASRRMRGGTPVQLPQ